VDRYKSRFWALRLVTPRGVTEWALTLGQHTWYSVPQTEVMPWWRAHEDCHKQQFARDGWLRFCARYLWEYLAGRRAGLTHAQAYLNISYEREAQAAADACYAWLHRNLGRALPTMAQGSGLEH